MKDLPLKGYDMRNAHRKITRKKAIIAAAGVAVAATAAFAIPQASAGSRQPVAVPTVAEMRTMTGTAWATDPETGQTLVTADSTVNTEQWNNLLTTRSDKVRVERAPGRFTLLAEGGDAIFAGRGRCSLGFNVTLDNGAPGLLTAGHCTAAGRQWSLTQGGAPVATVQQSTFPGDGDFAVLSYNNRNTQAPSSVDTGNGTVQIRRAADPRVNQRVLRMGSTTGLRDGRVTALNATVNYPEGRVTGLIQTTVCAEGGDSGGPLFTQDGTALGLTSGGSGDCRQGGITFFQPVTEALNAFGAQLAQ
ncbi:S1 family peptidase [Kibdelosporangium persicum]|uniref:Streptogrisin-D-Precursor n=1 Tax=Kibdelosporangium persicum TaxID=2698649 RepID=A0ABX2F662_9PSEU|nr:S1 family peptidase [Kibdelosporangium persicum]NRN66851.1 Streptogrisin-D-Precursor [Kibdelosporangium persicum]